MTIQRIIFQTFNNDNEKDIEYRSKIIKMIYESDKLYDLALRTFTLENFYYFRSTYASYNRKEKYKNYNRINRIRTRAAYNNNEGIPFFLESSYSIQEIIDHISEIIREELAYSFASASHILRNMSIMDSSYVDSNRELIKYFSELFNVSSIIYGITHTNPIYSYHEDIDISIIKGYIDILDNYIKCMEYDYEIESIFIERINDYTDNDNYNMLKKYIMSLINIGSEDIKTQELKGNTIADMYNTIHKDKMPSIESHSNIKGSFSYIDINEGNNKSNLLLYPKTRNIYNIEYSNIDNIYDTVQWKNYFTDKNSNILNNNIMIDSDQVFRISTFKSFIPQLNPLVKFSIKNNSYNYGRNIDLDKRIKEVKKYTEKLLDPEFRKVILKYKLFEYYNHIELNKNAFHSNSDYPMLCSMFWKYNYKEMYNFVVRMNDPVLALDKLVRIIYINPESAWMH